MNIPIFHYIYFWLFNSLMATGTGLVMGFMALRVGGIFIYSPLTFSLGFFLFYQCIVPPYFWGKRRGEFEYSFLEKSAERGKPNKELQGIFKDVKRELKMGDATAAHVKLETAVKAYPDNFVVIFKYAVSCERLGLAYDAIAAYEVARKLLPESAEALLTYVDKQIRRVNIKGPAKMSTAPGLQYVLY